MEKPKVVRKKDIPLSPILFGGKEGDAGQWSMFDKELKGLIFGTAEINPGFAAHRWHKHIIDKVPEAGFQINYHRDFEEFYYIINGEGTLQWEGEGGKVEETEVGPGDILFFPRGLGKHQLLNTGKEKMFMIWGGGPPAQIVPIT